jgi:carbonic anhydrase
MMHPQIESLQSLRRKFRPVAAAISATILLFSGIALADAPAAHHWTYSGETGPAHWASEDPAFATCGLGKAQSPIDIEKTKKLDLPPLEFSYQPTALRVTDTGHSMQLNYQPGSRLTVGGMSYELVQIHFHKPSEEHVHGQPYAMVAHMVHKNEQGDLAVVAVLMRAGATNAFLKPIFDNFPAPGQPESVVADQTVNAQSFLPTALGYYSFDGSLTTPPCSEHVKWFVLKSAVEISAAQINQFGSRYAKNARPVQPLNGRTVLESKN